MKDKILVFIIGLLVGAIIATTCFFIFDKVNSKNHQFPSGNKMEFRQMNDGMTPPDKPDGEENSNQKREQKQDNSNKDSNKVNAENNK